MTTPHTKAKIYYWSAVASATAAAGIYGGAAHALATLAVGLLFAAAWTLMPGVKR